ncbi:hypothetical protein MKW92_017187, partial [Papaver armeniacum]
FHEHLFLGNNRESDYDAFKASFPMHQPMTKHTNCQGLVIYWDTEKQVAVWSREEPDSPFWSLPGIKKPKSETELALERKVSDLETNISILIAHITALQRGPI